MLYISWQSFGDICRNYSKSISGSGYMKFSEFKLEEKYKVTSPNKLMSHDCSLIHTSLQNSELA